jgi:hypothetical protein
MLMWVCPSCQSENDLPQPTVTNTTFTCEACNKPFYLIDNPEDPNSWILESGIAQN